jgi:uncharacterized protein (TIGR00369 family)
LQSDAEVQETARGSVAGEFGVAGELGAAGSRSGWFGQIGLEIVSASASEVLAEWTVAERHLQPHGIVHGGVYASVVESCCSVGAVLAAPPGKQVVGVENHTSFLRPVGAGRLRARATPLHAGRQAQLWECAIRDERERLIATGRLRVFCVDPPAAETSSVGSPGARRDAGGR